MGEEGPVSYCWSKREGPCDKGCGQTLVAESSPDYQPTREQEPQCYS